MNCSTCHKEYIISDPSSFEFDNNESICKNCWLTVFNETSWGSKREERIIFAYKKVFISYSLRWKIWERDNFTCQNCSTRKNLTIDHIRPESKGGDLSPENLQTLCRLCNSKKNA